MAVKAKAKGSAAPAPSASDKVAALSRALLESLLAEQKAAKVAKGMLKCPRCGAAVEPTKNGRIRTHDADPYDQLRCPASGQAWKDSGRVPEAAPLKVEKKTKPKATSTITKPAVIKKTKRR